MLAFDLDMASCAVALMVMAPAPDRHSDACARLRAVVRGLVPPDVGAPARIFSPDYYNSQAYSSLLDRMTFYRVPGVTMTVFDAHGLIWTRGYGVLQTGTDRPVTSSSLFEAASATKILTTVLALRLVEHGVLDLDRDVNDYLKTWKLPESPLTAGRPVTLRLLLSHLAGLNRPDNGLPFNERRPPTLRQLLAGAPPAINQGLVIERAPATTHKYSNIGFLVVQLVMEDVTGKTYQQMAHELVLEPLGLESSTVSHPLTPDQRLRWGVPHDEWGVAHARNQMPHAVGHGGLVATSSDLARLALEICLAYRGESTRLLSKPSAELMMTKTADLDPRQFGAPAGQGLGAMLLGEAETLHFFHPGSNAPGTNCWVIASPVTGNGAVVMTNAASGEALILETLASIAHHYEWPDLARSPVTR